VSKDLLDPKFPAQRIKAKPSISFEKSLLSKSTLFEPKENLASQFNAVVEPITAFLPTSDSSKTNTISYPIQESHGEATLELLSIQPKVSV